MYSHIFTASIVKIRIDAFLKRGCKYVWLLGTEKRERGAKKKWVTKDESKGVRQNIWLSL